MNLYDSRGRPVPIGAEIGRGGEATVYRLANQPAAVAKIFEPQPRPNYEMKLGWMVAHPPENPTAKLQHASLAWPDALLYDSQKKLRGYRMPYIAQAVPLLEVFNPRRRAEKLPQFNRRYLHRTAYNLAAALSSLHRSGYVAGDINESNVFVTPTALVTILDTDSFQVVEQRGGTEVLYPCPVGKADYTPPELQGKTLANVARTTDHDAFGLAVLIFQLLMEGSHPFRAQWLGQGDPPPLEKRIEMGAFPYVGGSDFPVAPPRNAPGLETLHPNLAELFRRCFVHGHRSPRWRPGPDLWARTLAEAESSLVCCAEGHYYGSHLVECPYCALLHKRPNVATARTAGEADRVWAAPPFNGPRPAPRAAPQRPAAQPRGRVRVGFGGWPGRAVPAGAQAGYGGSGTAAVLRNRPLVRPAAVRGFLRQAVIKSVRFGAGQGALVGALPAALIGLVNWSIGSPLNWVLLLSASGAAGGLLRGWRPGYRLAGLIDRYVGWKRFWEVIGAIIGASVGLMVGMIGALAVVPIFLGFFVGLYIGQYAGGKFWQTGNSLGWERIGGAITALGASGLAWGFARLMGNVFLNDLGAQLATALMVTSGDGSMLSAATWLLAGGASGALSGALAGLLIDLLGRLSRLTD